MEVITNYYEEWIAQQTALEQERINPILNQTRNLIDQAISERGGERESFFANMDITGYSYSAQIADIFEFLTPAIQDLFETVWTVAGNPLAGPNSLICHLTRQNGLVSVFGEGSESIQKYQAHVVTFIFDAERAVIQASIKDDEAKIKLDPDSLWRPQPLRGNKVKHYLKALDKSHETRARLALHLAENATRPQVLSRSQRVEV